MKAFASKKYSLKIAKKKATETKLMPAVGSVEQFLRNQCKLDERICDVFIHHHKLDNFIRLFCVSKEFLFFFKHTLQDGSQITLSIPQIFIILKQIFLLFLKYYNFGQESATQLLQYEIREVDELVKIYRANKDITTVITQGITNEEFIEKMKQYMEDLVKDSNLVFKLETMRKEVGSFQSFMQNIEQQTYELMKIEHKNEKQWGVKSNFCELLDKNFPDIKQAVKDSQKLKLFYTGIKICITGPLKSGKTSLINKLLREEEYVKEDVLPTSSQPCTICKTTIKYGKTKQFKIGDEPFQTIADGKLLVENEDYVSAIFNQQNRNLQKDVLVTIPSPLLQCGIELVDMPGLSENECLDDEVKQELKHMNLILFVIDPKNGLRQEDANALQFISSHSTCKIMIIFSKFDQFYYDAYRSMQSETEIKESLQLIAKQAKHCLKLHLLESELLESDYFAPFSLSFEDRFIQYREQFIFKFCNLIHSSVNISYAHYKTVINISLDKVISFYLETGLNSEQADLFWKRLETLLRVEIYQLNFVYLKEFISPIVKGIMVNNYSSYLQFYQTKRSVFEQNVEQLVTKELQSSQVINYFNHVLQTASAHRLDDSLLFFKLSKDQFAQLQQQSFNNSLIEQFCKESCEKLCNSIEQFKQDEEFKIRKLKNAVQQKKLQNGGARDDAYVQKVEDELLKVWAMYQNYFFKFEFALTFSQAKMVQQVTTGQTKGEGSYGTVKHAVFNGIVTAEKLFKETFDYKEFFLMKSFHLLNPTQFPELYGISLDDKYYLMEMFDCSLAEFDTYVKKVSVVEMIDLLITIGNTLFQLHKQNYAHRDIKPNNILLNIEERRVVLIDFGTCCKHALEPLYCESLIGTVKYMAPEIVPGNTYYPNKVDVYSFALTVEAILREYNVDIDLKEFKSDAKIRKGMIDFVEKLFHFNIDYLKTYLVYFKNCNLFDGKEEIVKYDTILTSPKIVRHVRQVIITNFKSIIGSNNTRLFERKSATKFMQQLNNFLSLFCNLTDLQIRVYWNVEKTFPSEILEVLKVCTVPISLYCNTLAELEKIAKERQAGNLKYCIDGPLDAILQLLKTNWSMFDYFCDKKKQNEDVMLGYFTAKFKIREVNNIQTVHDCKPLFLHDENIVEVVILLLKVCNVLLDIFQKLQMREIALVDGKVKALKIIVNSIISLQSLDLSNNNVTYEGVRELSKCIVSLTLLQHLNLSRNEIGDDGVKELSKSIASLTSLQSLDLSKNNIRYEGLKELSNRIVSLTCLQSLNLKSNKIGDEGVRHLSKSLVSLTLLQHLNLSKNKIGDDGMKELSKSIDSLTSLKSLNLSWNKIGDEGVMELSKSIISLTCLQTLNLRSNNIGDEGVIKLSKSLLSLSRLESLNLSWNEIGDKGVKELSKSIVSLTSLQSLNLIENEIGDEGRKILQKEELQKLQDQTILIY